MKFDTFLGIFGFIIGVIGLWTGYYFYRKSIHDQRPRWSIKSKNYYKYHKDQQPDETIFIKGKMIQNLTLSTIILWNNGSKTIKNDDVIESSPLRVKAVDNTLILKSTIKSQSNSISDTHAIKTEDDSTVSIHIKYLKPGQWLMMEILHTGPSSDSVTLLGDFYDSNIHYHRNVLTKSQIRSMNILLFLSILGSAGMVIGTLGLFNSPDPKIKNDWSYKILENIYPLSWISIFGISLLLFGAYTQNKFNYPPEGIDNFENN